MTPAERTRVFEALAKKTGGQLKEFFVAHQLGTAFENDRNRNYGRPKRIADAIEAAEERDGDDRVLRAAVVKFGLADLLSEQVTPGLSELVDKVAERPDWENVQRALTAAAAEVHHNPAAAITASRTSIESVCKHICAERGVSYQDADDLPKLYNQTIHALNLAPGQHRDDASVRQTLQGAVSVVNGLAALRNAFGDAHGKAKGAPATPAAYGFLAVNMATGVIRLLLDAHSQ